MVRIRSAIWDGVQVRPVTVECELFRGGLPQWVVTGLPRAAAAESKERVTSALRAIGIRPPRARLVTNFTPAELPKSGSSLDLALALALMQLFGYGQWDDVAAVGELGINGECHPFAGWLPVVESLAKQGKVICSPPPHAAHLLVLQERSQVQILPRIAQTLTSVSVPDVSPDTLRYFLRDSRAALPFLQHCSLELFQVLQVAAVGRFPLLLYGHPGSGKTTARVGLSSLQPPLSLDGAHQWCSHDLPFPLPATTLLEPGIVPPQNEHFRSTGTVLVCDELPLWKSSAHEWLRQEIDQGGQTLLATANPCPCGWWGHSQCSCTEKSIQSWLRRISGPLLDRFPIHYRVFDGDIVWFSQENWNQARESVQQAQAYLQIEEEGEVRWNWSDVLSRLSDSVVRSIPDTWSLRHRTQAGQLALALAALEQRAPVEADLHAVSAWLSQERATNSP